jgi:acyl-CoA thioester hydrolase
MGVVYHTRYLEWFEAARTEMLRDMGLPYKKLESGGFFLPVIEAGCTYLAPARYDEVIEVRTFLNAINRLKIELVYEVWNSESSLILAKGRTLHCFTNKDGRPVRADQHVVDRMKTQADIL